MTAFERLSANRMAVRYEQHLGLSPIGDFARAATALQRQIDGKWRFLILHEAKKWRVAQTGKGTLGPPIIHFLTASPIRVELRELTLP
jgi:hypothetical protein